MPYPEWFKKQEETKMQASIMPNILQESWNKVVPTAQPAQPTGQFPLAQPVTAQLGTPERTQQLLARGEQMIQELTPVGKVVTDIVKPSTGEAPKDLAVDLAKDIETKTSPGFSEWVIQQPDWEGLFKQALEAGGMSTIKTEVDKIQVEVDRITGKYDEDIGKVEENPFMSDSQKRSNIARLKALTNAELTPLLSQYEKLKDRTAEIVRTAERTLGFMEKGYQFAATEAERQRTEAGRQRDDQRAMVKQQIDTGAFGDFSDEDLQAIADSGLGYDISTLEKMRDAVKAGQELKVEKTLQQMDIASKNLELRQQAAELAEAKFEAAQAKGVGTLTERTTAAKGQAVSKARPELEKNIGKDGYADPKIYTKLRSDFAEVFGDTSAFDEVFALMLSPQERARLGVGKAVGVKAEEEVETLRKPTATVIGKVEALKTSNASVKDIEDFIRFSGFEPSQTDFKLSGYTPKEKSWKFWE